ncbi:MAG: nuclear transport factor 2 family protein [Bauldia sp.]|nr:nuclear transport factor 2 family protein [Bauldia sp.]
MTAYESEAAATIRRLEAARLDAMCNRDLAALDAILATEFRYTHSDGSIDGKEDLRRRVAGDDVRYRDGRIAEVEVRVHGDLATGHGRLQLTVEVGPDAYRLDNRTLSVWIRRDGSWQLLAVASTPLRPVAPEREATP